ncbi:unnamed protein product [Bursaphelenchus xylophilus]|uniref:(pine wood nematode) hypothetical protein n=1 Tax=Bursaphelenchus xylophilus TaxID=6326 RepID=A0A811KLB8_BURXY|nr:unnamed protein product [Bursaphelenchus xylophilus]CAG9098834.1 unnamed protein product [Bursaphelenchus xylophilus]
MYMFMNGMFPFAVIRMPVFSMDRKRPTITGLITSGYGQYPDYLNINWFIWDYPCIASIRNYNLNNVCITAMILYYFGSELNPIHVFPGILARYNVKNCPSILPPMKLKEITLDLCQQETITGTISHHNIHTIYFDLSPYFSSPYSFASGLEPNSRLVSSLKNVNVIMKMKSGYYVYNKNRSMLAMVDSLFVCGVRLDSFKVSLIELGCVPIRRNYVDWMYQDLVDELQRIAFSGITTTFEVKLRVKLHQAWTLKQVAQAHLSCLDPGNTVDRIQALVEKTEIKFTHRIGRLTVKFKIEHDMNAPRYKPY